MSSNHETLATLLRSFRELKQLTQEVLADECGVSVHTISKLERGVQRYPYSDTLEKLVDGLKLSEADAERLVRAAARPRKRFAPRPNLSNGVVDPPPTNLKPSHTSLIGRDSIVADVAASVKTSRIVTLVGAPGVGKTRLALAVGADLASTFRGGVWVVQFSPIRDPALIGDAIAATVGVQIGGRQTLGEALLSFFHARDSLLILDNCEHLVDHIAKYLEPIVASCDRVTVLSTSREPLGLSGEETYRVPSLTVPPATAMRSSELLNFEAVRLFVTRAHAANDSFALTESNGPFVANICRRLDGIPFAIELAAGRIDVLGVEDIANLLDQRFRLLTNGRKAPLGRHQTMQQLIDWSFDLLTLRERWLLQRLAIAPGGWSLDAAEHVCGFGDLAPADVLDLLASLVRKSLVAADLTQGHARYGLLESIRAYLLERTDALREREEVEERHASWMAAFADRLRDDLHRFPRERCIPLLRNEIDNARAGLDWSLREPGGTAIAARIIAAYRSYWVDTKLIEEGRRWMARLFAFLDGSKRDAISGSAWHSLSILTTGNQSAAAVREAIACFDAVGDDRNSALAHMQLFAAYRQLGDFPQAESAIDKALTYLRKVRDERPLLYANALSWRGLALLSLGRLAEARACLEESIAVDEANGDAERAAIERLNLAELEFADDNVEGALAHVEAMLHNNGDRADNAHVVVAYLNAAAYRILLGEFDEARKSARAALQKARNVDARIWRVIALQHIATTFAVGGDASRAAQLDGYVEAYYTSEGVVREPTELRTSEILAAALKECLTSHQMESLRRIGARLSEEGAIGLALSDGSS